VFRGNRSITQIRQLSRRTGLSQYGARGAAFGGGAVQCAGVGGLEA
jgi:hypothetical protein